jgi:Tol biopolymer transport system component
MIAFDDADRAIAAWLDDAAAGPAPGYLGDALARVGSSRQRRGGFTWPARMPSPLARRAGVLLAVTALLLAIVGLSLLAGSTRPPSRIALPTLGLLVTSREGGVWVAQPDGSDARRISPDDIQLRGPQWSVDGTRIAAWGARVPSNGSIHPGEVYVMDADGGGIRSVTPTLDPMFVDAVAWSPDDRRIAIGAEGRLYVAEADGRRAIAIEEASIPGVAQAARAISWSPDGNELAVVVPRAGSGTERGLAVVDVRTGGVTMVPTAGPLSDGSVSSAAWSPTGDAIAYVATERLVGDWWTGQHIMVARRNQGSWNESVLVRGPEPARFEVTRKPIPELFAWPAWSNDGTRITWIEGAFGERPALWVLAPDGSAPRTLAELSTPAIPPLDAAQGDVGPPAWLPDDSRIVVPNWQDSELSFLLVDPRGLAPAASMQAQGGTADWQGVAP